MPLHSVNIEGTLVNDLSPLQGMPLKELDCHTTLVSDLSPLTGMDLTFASFIPCRIAKNIDVIRRMSTIKEISPRDGNSRGYTAAEFWTRYDAGEFGKAMSTAP